MIRLRLTAITLLALMSIAIAAPADEPLWKRALRFLGVSATPGNQRGEEDRVGAGNIHLYNVETKGGGQVKAGSFRSPIFFGDDDNLLALTGEQLVKITLSTGTVAPLCSIPGVKKLVGISSDAADQVLLLRDLDQDNCPSVGILSLANCQVESVPIAGRDDEASVSYMRGWDREYEGMKLETRKKTKQVNGREVEWTDVWLMPKNKDSINISRCDGTNCGQPAISKDGKFVVFVRAL
jgi:hypothetical protein